MPLRTPVLAFYAFKVIFSMFAYPHVLCSGGISADSRSVNHSFSHQAEFIKYGPLNLADENYWKEYAKKWNTKSEIAKKSPTPSKDIE